MNYIDLHNHCFTAMDDGVQSDEDALKMILTAIKSGIKIMYVTPHREPKGRFDPENETVLKAWRKLRRQVLSHDLDLDVRYGEEFRIKTDSIDLIKNNQVLCYYKTDYVLIEFTRTNVFSKLVTQAIDAFHEQGKMILIAHPERYFDDVSDAIKTCKSWVQQGCFLQINRTSLTGYHGSYTEKIANKLIQLGLAHVVATDAHEGDGERACRLDDVYHQVVKKHSQAQADMLFLTNPTLLTENKPMQAVIKPKRRLNLVVKIENRIKTTLAINSEKKAQALALVEKQKQERDAFLRKQEEEAQVLESARLKEQADLEAQQKAEELKKEKLLLKALKTQETREKAQLATLEKAKAKEAAKLETEKQRVERNAKQARIDALAEDEARQSADEEEAAKLTETISRNTQTDDQANEISTVEKAAMLSEEAVRADNIETEKSERMILVAQAREEALAMKQAKKQARRQNNGLLALFRKKKSEPQQAQHEEPDTKPEEE